MEKRKMEQAKNNSGFWIHKPVTSHDGHLGLIARLNPDAVQIEEDMPNRDEILGKIKSRKIQNSNLIIRINAGLKNRNQHSHYEGLSREIYAHLVGYASLYFDKNASYTQITVDDGWKYTIDVKRCERDDIKYFEERTFNYIQSIGGKVRFDIKHTFLRTTIEISITDVVTEVHLDAYVPDVYISAGILNFTCVFHSEIMEFEHHENVWSPLSWITDGSTQYYIGQFPMDVVSVARDYLSSVMNPQKPMTVKTSVSVKIS
jgi:hypothetical protein